MDYELIVECGADLPGKTIPFTRKHFLDLKDLHLFRDRFSNRGIYHTQMIYVNPIWIKNNKDQLIIDASNSMKISGFYLDFDGSGNPKETFLSVKKDVMQAIKVLHKLYEVPLECISLYFSGFKGIHLVISYEHLQFKPTPHLHLGYKRLAARIENHLKHQTLDVKIYDDKRLFRYSNSIHLKTNLFKIGLTIEELVHYNYDQICVLAKQKRSISPSKPTLCRRLVGLLENELIQIEEEKKPKKTRFIQDMDAEIPACIQAMEQKLFYETIDQRNNSCAALASFYYQKQWDLESVLDKMIVWNQLNCVPPLPEKEIQRTVSSVFDHGYTYGCDSFEEHSGVCIGKKCPYFAR